MRRYRLPFAALAASFALPALAQTPAAPSARFRLLQGACPADLHDQARRQRALRLLSRLRHADAAAAAARGRGDLERRGRAQELRAHRARACVPGKPDDSRLLRIRSPRARAAIRITTAASTGRRRDDPEWQTLAAWVRGATLQRRVPSAAAARRGSSRPTAPATTCTSSIRRRTRSSARSRGIEVGHGAAAAPDGSRIYVSNEADSTLDVVDGAHAARDEQGAAERPPEQHLDQPRRRARLRRDPAGARRRRRRSTRRRCTRVKSIPIKGDVHNTYVTPDGRYVDRGLDRRQDAHRDRPADRGAGVGRSTSISACGRWRSSRTPTARRSACSCS